MKTYQSIILTVIVATVAALATTFTKNYIQTVSVPQPYPSNYTAVVVGVRNGTDGGRMDEKFFIGRLPEVGDLVAMVYVGRDAEGDLRFQYRTLEVNQ